MEQEKLGQQEVQELQDILGPQVRQAQPVRREIQDQREQLEALAVSDQLDRLEAQVLMARPVKPEEQVLPVPRVLQAIMVLQEVPAQQG